MANILTQKVKYKRRSISTDTTNTVTFFLDSIPSYVPAVGQTVLVSHTDLPAGDSGIKSKIITAQTNIFSAKFYQYIEKTTPVDGYSYFFVLQYDDPTLGSNLGAGSTTGVIEFAYNPDNYTIMKPVEASVIVQEQQLFNDNNGYVVLNGYKEGAGTSTAIAPMLIVNRDNINGPFSNLFKTFNLPVTDSEIAEFTQTPLGYLSVSDSTNYDYVKDGIYYKWTESSAKPEVIHPVSGYTGTYYGTAYAGLCPQVNGAAYNKILVIEIPHSNYGEIIDGKSIRVNIPTSDGGDYYTLFSAYQENSDLFNTTGLDSFLSENGFLATNFGVGLPTELTTTTTTATTAVSTYSNYQSNVALLFSDNIKRPGGNLEKSWSTGWDEMINDPNRKVYNSSASVQKERFKLYDDTCVGIAYLDKGFIVITNPTIIDNFVNNIYDDGAIFYGDDAYTGTNIDAKLITNYENDGVTIDTENTQFLLTGTFDNFNVAYRSYNTEKSLNVVCLASTNEFFKTTNSTAKSLVGKAENIDYADLKNDTNNLYPVIITEIGLHDADGNLLAICKPTAPIKKYWYDVVSFNIRIRL